MEKRNINLGKQMNKIRESEGSSPLLFKTNRQLYSKRKKNLDLSVFVSTDKILKLLVKKNQSNVENKRKIKRVQTQKNQSTNTVIIKQKYSELSQTKRCLQSKLKKQKCSVQLFRLYKSFEKCLNSDTQEQLQSNEIDFYDTLNILITNDLQRNRRAQISTGIEVKNKNIKQNMLILQNTKLQKQNMLLRKQINITLFPSQYQEKQAQKNKAFMCSQQMFQTKMKAFADQKRKKYGQKKDNSNLSLDVEQLMIDFINNQRKLEVKNQQHEIMKRQIESLKQEVFLLREEKKSLKQRISELKSNNQSLCSQIVNMQIKTRKAGTTDTQKQAIMAMQYQQILSYKVQMLQLKKLYIYLNKKYKALLAKFRKIDQNQRDKDNLIYNNYHQIFYQQLQAFQQLRRKKQNLVKFNINFHKQRKLQKQITYQQCFQPQQTINNVEGTQKTYALNHQYYHPSFYALIAEDLKFFGIDKVNFEHFNEKIKLNFIGTMRAILDCKFNQFILNNGGKGLSFPSFVIVWLNTFQLDLQKKIEKIPQNSLSTKQLTCTFYVNLMSQKLNSSWQVIAFRQFLLQTFTNDELFFYLNLRFYLIGGDMSSDLCYCFQQTYYIEYQKALETLKVVIKEEKGQTRRIFQQLVRSSRTYINNQSYINIHYFLRVMLQYYQLQKQQQIQRIVKTIQMITQGLVCNISLMEFKKILTLHFKFLSFTEIVQLHRKCYCVGSGNITVEIILTVLNEESVFLKWSQILILAELIKIREKKQGNEEPSYQISPGIDWLYQNQKLYKVIYNKQVKGSSIKLGIEHFHESIQSNLNLNSFSIFERLRLCFDLCMIVTKKLYYSGVMGTEELGKPLQLTMGFLEELSKHTLQKNEIIDVMRDLKYQTASSRLVRFYRMKKCEMTRSILYHYQVNLMQKKNQHLQLLRSQFRNIISQIKSKKRILSRNNLMELSENFIYE